MYKEVSSNRFVGVHYVYTIDSWIEYAVVHQLLWYIIQTIIHPCIGLSLGLFLFQMYLIIDIRNTKFSSTFKKMIFLINFINLIYLFLFYF